PRTVAAAGRLPASGARTGPGTVARRRGMRGRRTRSPAPASRRVAAARPEPAGSSGRGEAPAPAGAPGPAGSSGRGEAPGRVAAARRPTVAPWGPAARPDGAEP